MPKDAEPLARLCRELNRRFEFLSPLRTTPEHFAALLSADRLEEVDVEIHFACETTQVAYVLYAIQPLFEGLSFQNIERSERFFTHQGKPLTANNLSKSKSDNPKEKAHIDRISQEIFDKKQ